MIESNEKESSHAQTARMRELNGQTASDVPPIVGLSSLGAKITGWTSNLLATAVIVVIALTFGSQLVSSWFPGTSEFESPAFDIGGAWPTIQACSLEFGDSPFQLTRETIAGTESEVVLFLQRRCREALERGTQPVGEIGEQEARLIAHSVDRKPVEQLDGKWRIFLSPKISDTGSLPMALGIVDGYPDSSNAISEQASSTSRLVVWALAMPSDNGNWTTFVGQAATLNSSMDLDQLLPENANRTLAMTDPNGGSMIGFSGGELDAAIAYYLNVAEKRNWKPIAEPVRTENSWSTRFLTTQKSKIAGIQIQLTLDHNENLTGILIVQSANRLDDKTAGIIQSP